MLQIGFEGRECCCWWYTTGHDAAAEGTTRALVPDAGKQS